jgi:hypothetical protein
MKSKEFPKVRRQQMEAKHGHGRKTQMGRGEKGVES